ncbi:MAG: cytochrome C oxidase subunit IV [Pseudonocardiales bacterium]|nr:MAG: cytochrome C oxidase subunit IV [Pseudonocardiales bacterium]
MKTEARIFLFVTVFCMVAAAVYLPWSRDPIGGTALIVSAGLCGLCGSYFWFVSRRIGARPEDRPDADISEGAGELGFFSPGSYWPVGVGGAAALLGLGLVYWPAYWLIAVGFIAVLLTAGGLVFEYYVK